MKNKKIYSLVNAALIAAMYVALTYLSSAFGLAYGEVQFRLSEVLMLFAAYGIQIAKTNPRMKRLFPLALVLEVVACLAWNWFKLKGRGMI